MSRRKVGLLMAARISSVSLMPVTARALKAGKIDEKRDGTKPFMKKIEIKTKKGSESKVYTP